MILAEAITPPAGIATWLACAAFVLMLLNQGGALLDKVRGKKMEVQQPLTIQQAEKFVNKASWNTHCEINRAEHRRLEDKCESSTAALRIELRKMESEILNAGEDRAVRLRGIMDDGLGGVHMRLNELFTAVGRLQGRVEGTHS